MTDDSFDVMEAQSKLNVFMKKELSEKQYIVYDLLFVQHKEEEVVAKIMGYKTSEKGRKAGYKQIKNLKKVFKDKAQAILQREDVIPVKGAIFWS